MSNIECLYSLSSLCHLPVAFQTINGDTSTGMGMEESDIAN